MEERCCCVTPWGSRGTERAASSDQAYSEAVWRLVALAEPLLAQYVPETASSTAILINTLRALLLLLLLLCCAGVWPGPVVPGAHTVGGQQLHGGHQPRPHGPPCLWLLAWRQAAG
jgi:hypothetical protein